MVQISPQHREACRARLAAVQAENRRLRTAAFVDYQPVVCGLRLRPITLRTYTTLLAWRNPFVTGAAIDLKAIAQFVWLHSAGFHQFAGRRRTRLFRRVARAFAPRCARLARAARHVYLHLLLFERRRAGRPSPLPLRRRLILGPLCLARPLLRRLARRPVAADLRAVAIAEIRRLVHEALHDFPPGPDDGEPSPYALHPQLVSLFVRGHGLDFRSAAALVDELPLKQLVEYLREILHRLSRGKDRLLTSGEAAIWRDYLADPPAEPAQIVNRQS